jgi:phosphoribosylanthranilate isomerase
MAVAVKICGMTTPEAVCAAAEFGADMVGFVFFAKSPRNVSIGRARALSASLAGRAQTVALVVNAGDRELAEIVEGLKPDWLQLHGEESPERVEDIRNRFGVPVLKAVGIARAEDLARAEAYLDRAESVLLDAKPPENLTLPGGNGLCFDWRLARDFSARTRKSWLLAGGLTPENVEEALRLTHARGVDVSSGVEDGPGQKSVAKIQAFIAAARRAQDQLGLAAGSV